MRGTLDLGLAGARRFEFAPGSNIAEIAQAACGDADVICLIRLPDGDPRGWAEVPRAMWGWIKPKVNDCIKFLSGQKGGRDIFAIIAVVVIAIAAPYLAGQAVTSLTAAGVASGTAAAIGTGLQAAITIGGSLLVSSLFSPAKPTLSNNPAEAQDERVSNVEVDSNLLARGARPPRVLGIRRVAPVDACQPWRFLEGGREVVRRCLVLGGPHEVSDIWIKGAGLDNFPSGTVRTSIKQGRDGDGHQTILSKVVKNININQTPPGFRKRANSNQITDQNTPANSEPTAVNFAPGYHPNMEQITIRFAISPLYVSDDATDNAVIPIRISFWNKETPGTVIRCPEVHIVGRGETPVQKEFRFRWDQEFGTATASKDYTYDLWRNVPAAGRTLSDGSSGDQWTAHSNFGSGGDKDTQNVTVTGDSINFLLDEATFPKADYEFAVEVGQPFKNSDFNDGNYQLNGTVESFFISYQDGTWRFPDDQDTVSGSIALSFSTMVVNETPVQTPGVTEIGVETIDRGLEAVTCIAGAIVKDWNGSAWAAEGTSENPGTHAYNAELETVNLFNTSATLIDSAAFVAWRQHCIDENFRIGYVTNGESVGEVLDQCMTAGFATKTMGDGYSVDYFRDRSAEIPLMTFSQRDSQVSIERTFPEVPNSLIAKFQNEDEDWRDDEVSINNQFGGAPFAGSEEILYQSIPSESQARKRGTFDLLQMFHRPRLLKLSTGPAGFNRNKGDLINIQHDLDNRESHGVFIREIVAANQIRIDREIEEQETQYLDFSADVSAEADISQVGIQSTIRIITPGGAETYTITNVSGATLTLDSDIPASWTVNATVYNRSELVGGRAIIATVESQFNRCIVLRTERQSKQKALLTCVDAADEMYAELKRRAA